MKTLHQTLRAIAVPALAMLLPFAVLAAPVTVDVTGAEGHAEVAFSPLNTVLLINLGANAKITGFSFGANITAVAPSEFRHVGFFLSDSEGTTGKEFEVTANDNLGSGTEQFASAHDFDLMVGEDGILRIEFFDVFDDAPGFDSKWNSGTFTFSVGTEAANTVPEPASLALVALALGAAGASSAKRRRQMR